MSTIPSTAHRDHVRSHHGDRVPDPFAWLARRDDPDVVAHLHRENDYAQERTAHLEELRQSLFDEIRRRTQESDLSVPVAYRGRWYYTRTRQGQQYAVQARVPVESGRDRPQLTDGEAPAGEQVLVDGNVEAGDGEFFSLGACEVDVAGDRVAFAADRSGDERFDVCVRDIATGETIDDAVRGVGYGLVWSLDGRHLFYTRVDDAWRPHEVWRHEVGRPADEDVLVLAEPDERFWLGIDVSRDDRRLIVTSASKQTSEVALLDLAEPLGRPRVVAPRRQGLEYEVEPAGDILLVVHNGRRPDFEIAWAPLDATSEQDWRPWLEVGEGERVLGVDAFAGHVVVSLRSDGLTALRVVPRDEGGGAAHGRPWDVEVDEALYTIGLGSNPDWEARSVQVVVESLVTPRTVAEVDVVTGERTVLKRQPVLGGYDPADYVQTREWASAPDGTRVPISIVRRADVPRDGTAPGLLYAYGAYEISMDPWFSIARLSLLDRGVVWAMAHVRGGGELGRSWYEAGRLEHKPNTFSDTIACADRLVDAGWVAPGRLALEGGSAGGLLVGAVLNLAPERFAVALAQVPFVDALTTILDPDQPLTVVEWEEWGDPLHDPEVYRLMKSYSPYENVAARPYPAILATTGLNDTRVSYAEPAKWVARLRETVTQDQEERPILLRTEMVAGHGGRSGRYDAWREVAWENAFLLDRLGAARELPPLRRR